MVTGSTCNVILLTKSNSQPYTTSAIMHVTSSKIIIGHPIDIPVIKVKKGVERMFEGMYVCVCVWWAGRTGGYCIGAGPKRQSQGMD